MGRNSEMRAFAEGADRNAGAERSVRMWPVNRVEGVTH